MENDPLENFIGSGLEPIPIQLDGYDSDPEFSVPTREVTRSLGSLIPDSDDHSVCSADSDEEFVVFESVQVWIVSSSCVLLLSNAVADTW